MNDASWILHFINVQPSPNVCTFWDIAYKEQWSPKFNNLKNLNFSPTPTWKLKYDEFLSLAFSQPKRIQKDPKDKKEIQKFNVKLMNTWFLPLLPESDFCLGRPCFSRSIQHCPCNLHKSPECSVRILESLHLGSFFCCATRMFLTPEVLFWKRLEGFYCLSENANICWAGFCSANRKTWAATFCTSTSTRWAEMKMPKRKFRAYCLERQELTLSRQARRTEGTDLILSLLLVFPIL